MLAIACFALISFMPAPEVRYQFSDSATGTVERKNERLAISLPSSIRRILRDDFPKYRLPISDDYKLDWLEFREQQPTPFITFGNFDGSGGRDIAVIILNPKKDDDWKLVAFHTFKDRVTPIVLEVSPKVVDGSRSFGPAQRYGVMTSSDCGKFPCIDFFVFESSSFKYVWNGKQYVEVNIAD